MGLTKSFGVTVKESRSTLVRPGDTEPLPIRYLSRTVDGEELRVALPGDFDPENKMGVWVVESVCRRLRISPYFKGWPIIL